MAAGKVLKKKKERDVETEAGRKVAREVITWGWVPGGRSSYFLRVFTGLHDSYWRLFSQILCPPCVCVCVCVVFKPVQENTLFSWEEGMMFPKAKQ